MYAEYFGLKHEPFSIAPDPRYLFMSERHREALAHLLYGLGGGGGFVLLSGEIGTGKTTVCRLFLEQIPADCNVAYIFNPKLTVIELLQSICDEFHIEVPVGRTATPTVKDYLDPLNAFLLAAHAAGRNNVLIIDEAQNLSAEVLEQLRLLTNLETRERKLLQIILIGQPELRTMLARPELEQLAQRVIARFHLDALTPVETGQYVRHRLEVAGLNRPMPIEPRALQRIHELSRGIPRRINLLCDRALLGAFANSRATVDRATVDQAGAEVFDAPAQPRVPRRRTAVVLGAGLIVGAGLYAAVSQVARDPQQRVAVAAPRAATPASSAATGASAPVRAASAASSVGSAPAVLASVAPVSSSTAPAAVTLVAASGAVASPASLAAPSASATVAGTAAAPALHRSMDAAWRDLAKAWNAPVPAGGDACKSLAREQFQCFSATMNLALIRELGRPGIVTLDAGTGALRYAILTSLTADTATLTAEGTQQTVTIAALASRWQGDFSTLLKSPPSYAGGVVDAKGPTIDWVAAQLASIDGRPAPAAPVVLDPQLKARLRAFQLAHGLPGDGQPGPMTFMQLNRAAGIDEPRLRNPT